MKKKTRELVDTADSKLSRRCTKKPLRKIPKNPLLKIAKKPPENMVTWTDNMVRELLMEIARVRNRVGPYYNVPDWGKDWREMKEMLAINSPEMFMHMTVRDLQIKSSQVFASASERVNFGSPVAPTDPFDHLIYEAYKDLILPPQKVGLGHPRGSAADSGSRSAAGSAS